MRPTGRSATDLQIVVWGFAEVGCGVAMGYAEHSGRHSGLE
jgi:hypothetical protein